MPTVHLTSRAIVSIDGPEAEHFLQNLITPDLAALAPGEAKPGALLTPQGKILFDFLIFQSDDGLRLECRADIADDLVKRLTIYKLRAKVGIVKQDQALVAVSWGDDSRSSQSGSSVRDLRFEDVVLRHYATTPPATADEATWTALRAQNGIAESGADYDLSDVFPHDVLYDQNGGVGLRKGCFVGQEVVSRMQHRGTARRRVMIAASDDALPDLRHRNHRRRASGRHARLECARQGHRHRADRPRQGCARRRSRHSRWRRQADADDSRLGALHAARTEDSRLMPDRRGAPARAWQRMLSGRRLDLLDPSPLDIEIGDIAHGLARVARWNGQTHGAHAFSVAQHSLVVETILRSIEPELEPRWQLAALLHDAPEYVIGDMISPFKQQIGDSYRIVEHRLQVAIHLRFGLPSTLPAPIRKAIKRADQIAAYHEATRLVEASAWPKR